MGGITMGILRGLLAVIETPLRLAVDVVKAPAKIVNGEEGLLENTNNGIDKIADELDKEGA